MPRKKKTEDVNHAVRAHALLSASAAHRWMVCTPSARLTENMPDETSPFAEEGTRAHEDAEKLLRMYFVMGKETATADDIRERDVLPYVSKVIDDYNELAKEHSDVFVQFETRLDLTKYIREGFGTADMIMIAGNTLYVRDLKYGRGVAVSALNNPQARLYALGALDLFEDLYDIDTVVIQIHQPRLDAFSEEVISVTDLREWAESELVPAAEKAYAGEGEFVAGEHCRFCKAKGLCEARVKQAFADLPAEQKAELIPVEQLGKVLDKAEELEALVKALKEQIFTELKNGKNIPGYKLVRKRTLRRYSDHVAVAQKLREAGYEDDLIYKKELNNLTEMGKLVGGAKKLDELLGDLIVKPEGELTLAKETDKRPAVSYNPALDFAGIEEKGE